MNKKTWAIVKGYSIYQISNTGLVMNLKRKTILKNRLDKDGYLTVHLREVGSKMLKIHRLIALHFCKGHKHGLVVNHIDGNKLNNNPTNLEWITSIENVKHSHATGLARYAYGDKAYGCKLNKDDIRLIKILGGKLSQSKIASIFGVGQTQIGRILRGDRWKHLIK